MVNVKRSLRVKRNTLLSLRVLENKAKNIPMFPFLYCWLLCLDSVRAFVGGEILLAKEYQGGGIWFS